MPPSPTFLSLSRPKVVPKALSYANQVVHEADIMPHSPADEGPLSRSITFDYIADNLALTTARMTRLASEGASSVARSLGGPVPLSATIPAFADGGVSGAGGGSGRGDVHVTIGDNVIQGGDQKSAKAIADEVASAVVREFTLS